MWPSVAQSPTLGQQTYLSKWFARYGVWVDRHGRQPAIEFARENLHVGCRV